MNNMKNNRAAQTTQAATMSGAKQENERLLNLEGGYNIRDLGGYAGYDGKHTVKGKLFRSDDLKDLSDSDLDTLSDIPLLTIVDFRTHNEVAGAPDRVPQSVREHYHFAIQPGSLSKELFMSASTREEVRGLMVKIYEELVTDTECTKQFRKFFGLIQNTENLPLLFHCSAGKDRTGLASALFLLGLGVDMETVLENYLESNANLASKYPDEEVFRVRPEYLHTALEIIARYPGGLEAYLAEVLDVDLRKLREMYLV
ncbi:tyrosine-protein phosphatase [Desulfovibrio sp. OttesenSCG-928-C06]|nr:tyrosine-protein phosphatase [Desulfovibrio sp. OttesenSCG-928-C06]